MNVNCPRDPLTCRCDYHAGHPVEVLRDHAVRLGRAIGREVDHDAFDAARRHLDEPVIADGPVERVNALFVAGEDIDPGVFVQYRDGRTLVTAARAWPTPPRCACGAPGPICRPCRAAAYAKRQRAEVRRRVLVPLAVVALFVALLAGGFALQHRWDAGCDAAHAGERWDADLWACVPR